MSGMAKVSPSSHKGRPLQHTCSIQVPQLGAYCIGMGKNACEVYSVTNRESEREREKKKCIAYKSTLDSHIAVMRLNIMLPLC